MKKVLIPIVASLATACGTEATREPAATGAPEAEAGSEEVAIPTEEEAAAEAAGTIDESNADEEYLKVREEIAAETET